MDYKHLLPALYEFIGDAFKWRATVGSILPESLEEETLQAIHQSEVAEYIHAVKHGHSAFDVSKELADVLWTGTYLIGLPTERQKQSNKGAWLNLGMLSFDPDHLQHLDPLVLKAVSDSNWSKIRDAMDPDPWISHLDKDRFLDVRVLWNFPKAIIVGTDYQNYDKPQFYKVLKPKGYRSAEEVYRELKKEEGRDD